MTTETKTTPKTLHGTPSSSTIKSCAGCTCANSSRPIRSERSILSRRGRRHLPRLFKKSDHGRDTEPAVGSRRGLRLARAHRCDVSRRKNQRLGKPRGSACRIAGSGQRLDRCGRRERRPAVHAVLDKMAGFADSVRNGAWKGHTGKPIVNVVNIGIGGSDLGPGDGVRSAALLHAARPDVSLRLQRRRTDFAEAVAISIRRDAVHRVVKNFTTLETMTNAHSARDWSVSGLAATRARSRNISSQSRPTPRRSRNSASTRPICSGSGIGWAAATRWTPRSACRRCLPSGPDNFRAMLAGFHEMDEHFRTAPFERICRC